MAAERASTILSGIFGSRVLNRGSHASKPTSHGAPHHISSEASSPPASSPGSSVLHTRYSSLLRLSLDEAPSPASLRSMRRDDILRLVSRLSEERASLLTALRSTLSVGDPVEMKGVIERLTALVAAGNASVEGMKGSMEATGVKLRALAEARNARAAAAAAATSTSGGAGEGEAPAVAAVDVVTPLEQALELSLHEHAVTRVEASAQRLALQSELMALREAAAREAERSREQCAVLREECTRTSSEVAVLKARVADARHKLAAVSMEADALRLENARLKLTLADVEGGRRPVPLSPESGAQVGATVAGASPADTRSRKDSGSTSHGAMSPRDAAGLETSASVPVALNTFAYLQHAPARSRRRSLTMRTVTKVVVPSSTPVPPREDGRATPAQAASTEATPTHALEATASPVRRARSGTAPAPLSPNLTRAGAAHAHGAAARGGIPLSASTTDLAFPIITSATASVGRAHTEETRYRGSFSSDLVMTLDEWTDRSAEFEYVNAAAHGRPGTRNSVLVDGPHAAHARDRVTPVLSHAAPHGQVAHVHGSGHVTPVAHSRGASNSSASAAGVDASRSSTAAVSDASHAANDSVSTKQPPAPAPASQQQASSSALSALSSAFSSLFRTKAAPAPAPPAASNVAESTVNVSAAAVPVAAVPSGGETVPSAADAARAVTPLNVGCIGAADAVASPPDAAPVVDVASPPDVTERATVTVESATTDSPSEPLKVSVDLFTGSPVPVKRDNVPPLKRRRSNSIPRVLIRSDSSSRSGGVARGNASDVHSLGDGVPTSRLSMHHFTPVQGTVATGDAASGPDLLARMFTALPLLRSLAPAERAIVAASFSVRTYCDQDVVYAAGGAVNLLLMVTEGTLLLLQPMSGAAPVDCIPAASAAARRMVRGDFFIGDALVSGSTAVARGDVTCLVLHGDVLAELLRWFARSRSLASADVAEQPSHDVVATDAPSLLLKRCRTAIAAATSRSAYVAAVRRFSESLNHLPLRSQRVRTVDAMRADVEQACKDITREHAVLMNGTSYTLGSPQQLAAFMIALTGVIRDELLLDDAFVRSLVRARQVDVVTSRARADAAHRAALGTDALVASLGTFLRPEALHTGSSPAALHAMLHRTVALHAGNVVDDDRRGDGATLDDEEQELARVKEDTISSIVCDILIAASRTSTGGDSFSLCHELLSNDLVFLAAESGAQPPTEVLIRGSTVAIQSVNVYKICHMLSPGELVLSAVDSDMTDSDASMQSWAILRCSITEIATYSAATMPNDSGQQESAHPAAVLRALASSADGDAGLSTALQTPLPSGHADAVETAHIERPLSTASLEGAAAMASVAPTAAPELAAAATSSLDVTIERSMDISIRLLVDTGE